MPLLKHQAADMYQSIFIIESSKLEPIFCVLDLLFWIAQVMYRGQTRYTRNLYLTSLIEAYYSTQHILELKYFLFAHFSLNVTWADPWPKKSENWTLETQARSLTPSWMISLSFSALLATVHWQVHSKIFCLHTISLNAHQAAYLPQKSGNLKFRTDLWDQVMDRWLIWI